MKFIWNLVEFLKKKKKLYSTLFCVALLDKLMHIAAITTFLTGKYGCLEVANIMYQIL